MTGLLCFYIALGVVALTYLLYLFAPKAKSWYLLGVSKKVRRILQANTKLQKGHTQKISEAITYIEALFTRGISVDYARLIGTMRKIRASNSELSAVIDLLIGQIETNRPYGLLSADKENAFVAVVKQIAAQNQSDAETALKLVYAQFVATEDEYRRKDRRKFWIGTVIGIIGLVLSIVQIIIK
ncbi:hypothetical protein FACS1894139_04060 [Planctomycetales bacterium]|nr:hypothetical protein FACS1894107_15480 [Planctomycetales bacterium]GHS97371.1 hypothetical protein FACS1894108_03650 [Planctomycetales bacterium]GHT03544.1 hypothetical protein FACS1894139_04060 [Planctomycetales bacterium]